MEFSLFSWGYFKYTISFQIMESYFLGKKKIMNMESFSYNTLGYKHTIMKAIDIEDIK